MVTGWSYFVGSSGSVAPFISCTSAFPRDVTRNETSIFAFPISCCGGSTVTPPSHLPARVFMVSKDLSASEGAAGLASDWANATEARNSRVITSVDFIPSLLRLNRAAGLIAAYSITVILNYNTKLKSRSFFGSLLNFCCAVDKSNTTAGKRLCQIRGDSEVRGSHLSQ